MFPLVVIELILKARGSCEREALREWHENCSSYRYLHSYIKASISQDQGDCLFIIVVYSPSLRVCIYRVGNELQEYDGSFHSEVGFWKTKNMSNRAPLSVVIHKSVV